MDGRQTACPGEVVTYTCTVTQGGAITWTAAPVLVGTAVRFLTIDPSGSSRSCVDPSSPVQCADLDYQATITSVGTLDMNGLADLTSTFRFTARAEINGTVVQCSAVTATSTLSVTQTVNVAGEFWLPRGTYILVSVTTPEFKDHCLLSLFKKCIQLHKQFEREQQIKWGIPCIS